MVKINPSALLHRTSKRIVVKVLGNNQAVVPSEHRKDAIEAIVKNQFKLNDSRFSNFKDGTYLYVDITILQNGSFSIEAVMEKNQVDNPIIGSQTPSNKSLELLGGEIWISDLNRIGLTTLDAITKKYGKAICLLTGDSGYGKTSIAEAYARETGRKLHIIDCTKINDSDQFFAKMIAKNGDTITVYTPLLELISTPNMVFLFDEITRVNQRVIAAIYELLDFRSEINYDGKTFKLGENCTIFLTANIGFEFTGTVQLDKALKSRKDMRLKVGPPSKSEEISLLVKRTGVDQSVAEKIVTAMEQLRDPKFAKAGIDPSVRTSLSIARKMTLGITDLKTIFTFDIGNDCEDGSLQDFAGVVDFYLKD